MTQLERDELRRLASSIGGLVERLLDDVDYLRTALETVKERLAKADECEFEEWGKAAEAERRAAFDTIRDALEATK